MGCQQNLNAPIGTPLHLWEWPSTSWEGVHIDFAGPFRGSMYLIMVDAHSKWPEVIRINKTTQKTIEVLKMVFARMCRQRKAQKQKFENEQSVVVRD